MLRALVLENGRQLLSADVRTRHRLPGPSSVQTALAALVREDIVLKDGARYVTTDSLYREWVARRTSRCVRATVRGVLKDGARYATTDSLFRRNGSRDGRPDFG